MLADLCATLLLCSHIFLGFELGLLGVVIAACGTAGGDYGALTWGIWLVAASLMVAPIWFNPLTFNMDNVAKDWVQWRQWLQGEKDPEVQSSWSNWNRCGACADTPQACTTHGSAHAAHAAGQQTQQPSTK